MIGNGVVLDPMAFLNEVKKLKDVGLPIDEQLFVSNRAQVILPYHRMIELAAENAPGRTKIGTTSRGIGPAYEDKMHRSGLRVVDLLNSALLRTHIQNACFREEHHRPCAVWDGAARPQGDVRGVRPGGREDRSLCDRHRRHAE